MPVPHVANPTPSPDTFSLTRLVEERGKGYTDRLAVVRGMYFTGHIITAAGIVMAIAFGALLFSEQPVLNEFGLFLCASVLFGACLVRCGFHPLFDRHVRISLPVSLAPPFSHDAADTFVVRTLLVPSIMGLLGASNWWPRRMPEPTRTRLSDSVSSDDFLPAMCRSCFSSPSTGTAMKPMT